MDIYKPSHIMMAFLSELELYCLGAFSTAVIIIWQSRFVHSKRLIWDNDR